MRSQDLGEPRRKHRPVVQELLVTNKKPPPLTARQLGLKVAANIQKQRFRQRKLIAFFERRRDLQWIPQRDDYDRLDRKLVEQLEPQWQQPRDAWVLHDEQ